jgi:RNase H-like domain found in reverse transcriptase
MKGGHGKEGRQKAFRNYGGEIKSKEVLLAYPDFKEEFIINTDASHTQLGAVIPQKGQAYCPSTAENSSLNKIDIPRRSENFKV